MTVALVAEDETPQRAELIAMLGTVWPELQIIECEDGIAAMEALDAQRPQIAFLDIRMPGVTGLEVAKAAQGRAQVIFTTAYEEHALEAFERGAVDYVLKPIKQDRLAVAVTRVRERLSSGASQNLSAVIEVLEQKLKQKQEAIKWITASAGNTTKMYSVDDVQFFQAQDKYTRVVTATDEAFIRTPLRELLDGLDTEQFWQIHRGVIVRVGAIQSLQRGDDGKLALRIKGRSEALPVSSAFNYRFKGM